jgi:hypothetical protein
MAEQPLASKVGLSSMELISYYYRGQSHRHHRVHSPDFTWDRLLTGSSHVR